MVDIEFFVGDASVQVGVLPGASGEGFGDRVEVRTRGFSDGLLLSQFEGLVSAVTRGVVGGIGNRRAVGNDAGGLGDFVAGKVGGETFEGAARSSGLGARVAFGAGRDVGGSEEIRVVDSSTSFNASGGRSAGHNSSGSVGTAGTSACHNCGVPEQVGRFNGASKESDRCGAEAQRVTFGPLGGLNSLPRGPNYERNLASRMRKQAAKSVTARVLGGSWRDKSELSAVTRDGFFSECDDGTQARLRDTRAKLLILENERKIIEETRKINELQSPMRMIEDAMHMVKRAGEFAKKEKDSAVAGWAATVATSYSESIAKSAPSSVPSFASSKSSKSSASAAVKKPMTEREIRLREENPWYEEDLAAAEAKKIAEAEKKHELNQRRLAAELLKGSSSTGKPVVKLASELNTPSVKPVKPAEVVEVTVPRRTGDWQRAHWMNTALTPMEKYVVSEKLMLSKAVRELRAERCRHLMPGDVIGKASVSKPQLHRMQTLNKSLDVTSISPEPVKKGWFGF